MMLMFCDTVEVEVDGAEDARVATPARERETKRVGVECSAE